MADSPVILDASALVALLCKEKGWQIIDKILRSKDAVTTPTGLAETFNICKRKNTGLSRTEIYEYLISLGLKVEPLIEEDALEIAFILERAALLPLNNPKSHSLSLADAACLALGRRLGGVVVFSDNFWEELDIPGIAISSFR